MNRRELVLMLGGAMTAARGLRAQQKAMPVIGYLGSAGPSAHYAAAFHQGLSETRYVEGQNVTIEYRWAGNRDDRLPALAADLVGRKVDLIVASGSLHCALAAKSATSTIPIVFPVPPPFDHCSPWLFSPSKTSMSCFVPSTPPGPSAAPMICFALWAPLGPSSARKASTSARIAIKAT